MNDALPEPERRQELLEALLEGRLDPTSEDARRAFELDPSLETEWRRAREIQGEMDAMSADVQEDLRNLDPRDEDEALARQVLEGVWNRGPESTPHSRFWHAAPWLAAAALLLGWVFWPDAETPPTRSSVEDERLLGDAVHSLQPSGQVRAGDLRLFRWSTEGIGTSFELKIMLADGATITEWVEGTEWVLSEDVQSRLGSSFRWSVAPRDQGSRTSQPAVVVEVRVTDG